MHAAFAPATTSGGSTGSRVVALAECAGLQWPVRKLGPGASVDERFTWYPAAEVGGDPSRLVPPSPGTVQVTATWAFVGRGPSGRRAWVASDHEPITVTGALELTGAGAGVPSFPELVDLALADPRFAAWVAVDPAREAWRVRVVRWPDVEEQASPHWTDLGHHVERGVVELSLTQRATADGTRVGYVDLDPWTGEVLNVAFE